MRKDNEVGSNREACMKSVRVARRNQSGGRNGGMEGNNSIEINRPKKINTDKLEVSSRKERDMK